MSRQGETGDEQLVSLIDQYNVIAGQCEPEHDLSVLRCRDWEDQYMLLVCSHL